MENEEETSTELDLLVPEGITHLMMWFGGGLPREKQISVHYWKSGEKPAYESNREREYIYSKYEKDKVIEQYAFIDYAETLRGECKKMQAKNEACILVYDSRMITKKEDEIELKKIVENIPNCYLVDYEDFIKKLDKNEYPDFVKDIDDMINANKQKRNHNTTLKGATIGNLVDCVRMLLLLKPRKLKELAIEKNPNKSALKSSSIKQDPMAFCLLYHDFDMIQTTKGDDIVKQNVLLRETKKKDNVDNDDDILNYKLVFCSSMDHGSSKSVENGIIFANSKNDKNTELENMISGYMSLVPYEKKGVSMYDDVIANMYKCRNNFARQFFDEGHRTWWDLGEEKMSQQEKEEDNTIMDEQSVNNNIKNEEPQHNKEEDNNKKRKNNDVSCTCIIV